MGKRSFFLYILLGALMMTGCHSTREARPSPTPAPAESHDYTVMNFTGTAEGMSVSGQVRMDRGKVIWCSVNKLIELGRAMATTDSVWLQVPMLKRYQKGDYKDLSRMAKRSLTFSDLQGILESNDAERRIAELAQSLGVALTVKITRREKVEKLTFPFER